MKISVIGDIIYDSLNEKELDIMRHFSRTELKAAINMLKEFTSKGNFAVLMYMGDTDKLEVSQTLNSDMSCFYYMEASSHSHFSLQKIFL